MNILYVGDIVGSPGRRAFAAVVERLRRQQTIDLVIANAENSAGGKGLTPDLAEELFARGAAVLTLGDHAWDQKSIIGYLPGQPRLLRPANWPPGCPGHGGVTVDTAAGPVTVFIFIGRVFMPPHADCPFRTADALLEGRPPGGVVLAEIHAEATSEKIAFGRYLDGRVSAVVGSHTHVQTSDETILPNGTAYLTDLGMTGPKDSVLGRDVPSIVRRFLTGMPGKFEVAEKNVALEGALLEIDERSGRARSIRRLRETVEEESPHAADSAA
jgi:metallophosphoesterase (TIGR00282 family)